MEVTKLRVLKATVAITLLVFVPHLAFAQGDGGVAGVVRDTSRAVLPGVTVEVASPALIEKSRTVVTDDQGNYKVVDLRPGEYTVTFTLSGFTTVKRAGVAVSAGVTSNVTAEMTVGSIEETITVTGAVPLVDVQNVTAHSVLSREVIDALPAAKNWQTMAVLTPGVQVAGVSSAQTGQDVGGTVGDRGVYLSVHGSRGGEMPLLLDGLRYNSANANGGGNTTLYKINTGTAQEIVMDVAGLTAEAEVSGVRVNVIPKEGGNRFQGSFYGAYTNKSLQSNNLTEDLRARGALSVPTYNRIADANPSFGGPLKTDAIWFYSGFRKQSTLENNSSTFYDQDPLDFVYTPDLSRPAITDIGFWSINGRVTWQASGKNKIGFFYDRQGGCNCGFQLGATRPPEGTVSFAYDNIGLMHGSWRAPLTNKLLVSVGQAWYMQYDSFPPFIEGQQPTYSVLEQSTGTIFRYLPGSFGVSREKHDTFNGKADVTYVTGSHALKIGMQWQTGDIRQWREYGNTDLILLNGQPTGVTVYTYPFYNNEHLKISGGVFAQDQWTIKRLTANVGIRLDFVNANVPEQHIPAVAFVGPRDFAEVTNVPNWKDFSPRMGVAWDVFGDGRTAIKGSLNRYVAAMATGIARLENPLFTTVLSTTRPWTDSNRDFIPQESELGPFANASFGQTVVRTRHDPDFLEGWGKRPYNWEGSASIQHQLTGGLAVNAAYFRHWYGNLLVNDNLAASPGDYDPYCITSPIDPRLPGGGGQPVCGFYDINPRARAIAPDNFVTFAKGYGDVTEVYDGVDVAANMRLQNGMFLQGGMNVGRMLTDNCDVVGKVDNIAGTIPANSVINTNLNFSTLASPSANFCRIAPPFQTQVKLMAMYPLPWSMQVSATYQSLPGPQVTASYAATLAQIQPSLGRPLSGGARTATVQLISPGTLYGERLHQIDTRLAKTFNVGPARLQGQIDLYNLMNANAVLAQNNTFGPAWQRPTAILPGRLLKFGLSVDF